MIGIAKDYQDLADYQFPGSHDNVVLAMIAGDFDSAATVKLRGAPVGSWLAGI